MFLPYDERGGGEWVPDLPEEVYPYRWRDAVLDFITICFEFLPSFLLIVVFPLSTLAAVGGSLLSEPLAVWGTVIMVLDALAIPLVYSIGDWIAL